jgi:hypothetical protein
MNIFTPKGFLQVGGVVLALVGILGFIGIIGPTPDRSLFGSLWWFDNPENWAHLVLGVVALLAASLLKDAGMQKNLVILVGVIALLVAVYNLFSTTLLGANLESPMDLVLHLIVGVWALKAALKKSAMPAAM